MKIGDDGATGGKKDWGTRETEVKGNEIEQWYVKNFEQACDCFNNGSFTVKNT